MINAIDYNWMYSTEYGEGFDTYKVGERDVTSIEEHSAAGDGDRWFYRVHFGNGDEIIIFNPNRVYKTDELKIKED